MQEEDVLCIVLIGIHEGAQVLSGYHLPGSTWLLIADSSNSFMLPCFGSKGHMDSLWYLQFHAGVMRLNKLKPFCLRRNRTVVNLFVVQRRHQVAACSAYQAEWNEGELCL
jgi:hypothetical protein